MYHHSSHLSDLLFFQLSTSLTYMCKSVSLAFIPKINDYNPIEISHTHELLIPPGFLKLVCDAMTTQSQKKLPGPTIQWSPVERCRATQTGFSLIRSDPHSTPLSLCLFWSPCPQGVSFGCPPRGSPLYNLSPAITPSRAAGVFPVGTLLYPSPWRPSSWLPCLLTFCSFCTHRGLHSWIMTGAVKWTNTHRLQTHQSEKAQVLFFLKNLTNECSWYSLGGRWPVLMVCTVPPTWPHRGVSVKYPSSPSDHHGEQSSRTAYSGSLKPTLCMTGF